MFCARGIGARAMEWEGFFPVLLEGAVLFPGAQ